MSIRNEDTPDTAIHALRQLLGPMTTSLEQARQQVEQVQTATVRMRQDLECLYHEVTQIRSTATTSLDSLESTLPRMLEDLQRLDATMTVLQRELTHLNEIQDIHPADQLDVRIQAISALLQLSLRLATLIFPPAQLQALADQSIPYALDTLRQRWQSWLGELINYLTQVLPLVHSLNAVDDEGLLTATYQQSLDQLCQQCERLGTSGMPDPVQPIMSNPIPPRQTANRFRGPLGTRNLLDTDAEETHDQIRS